MFAEVVDRRLCDPVVVDALTVELDTVRAAEILDEVIRAATNNRAVATRDVRVTDRQIRVLRTATDHKLILVDYVPLVLVAEVERPNLCWRP